MNKEGEVAVVEIQEVLGGEASPEFSVEGRMENPAEVAEIVAATEGEMNMSVAEKIALVSQATGGKSFTQGEINKMAIYLGSGNEFVVALNEVKDAEATVEYETFAAISKARYGENTSPEDEQKFEEIAAEMGITVEAAKEAMGNKIEMDDIDPGLLEGIRDAAEDFKGKHPGLFKFLKVAGLAAVLALGSSAAQAGSFQIGEDQDHGGGNQGNNNFKGHSTSHSQSTHGNAAHGPAAHHLASGHSAPASPASHGGVPMAQSGGHAYSSGGSSASNVSGGIDLSP